MQTVTWESGYGGNPGKWEQFLSCWDQEAMSWLRGEEAATPMEGKVFGRGSQVIPGASTEEIANVEERLERDLPTSLKDFWMVSNGLLHLRLDADNGRIFGTSEVGWVAERASSLLIEEVQLNAPSNVYFEYGEMQDPVNIREKYVNSMLMISNIFDAGVYLLNPRVKTVDGEWEAWFYGWELPGAYRFKSFAHLMTYSYYKATHELGEDKIPAWSELRGTCADVGLVESIE